MHATYSTVKPRLLVTVSNQRVVAEVTVMNHVVNDGSLHTITGGHLFGGVPGNTNLVKFNDSVAWNDGRITAIQMLCGKYLLAFKIQYNGVWSVQRGFWNPACSENQTWTPAHEFGEDEWIQHAAFTGSRWPSVTFTTNKRQLETCGVPVTSPRYLEGGRLEYVSGIFGCYFDELQFYWSNYRDSN
ncbi:uncharacterized protein LOC128216324 [Mya arenaria]|uniref:uncharacterized protein LOC128216320 n=1 Tax=Mya arenaria TaxID=6604 RepID=UPI0022DEE90A|nr:uncharacterized protein LOC128216320 [Mya arenaria]XP_052778844.1 uncharacterized protein LOC128216324 [Mya arenaria]